MSSWAVISLGNRFRGDDGVGPYVLDRLRPHIEPGVPCIENSGDLMDLLETWKDRCVCLVDAVAAGDREIGAIVRCDGLSASVLPSHCTSSSHGFSLKEALDLGRLVQAMPHRLDIYGICGGRFAICTGLSSEVHMAADIVAQEILALINTHNGDASCTSTH